MRLKNLVCCFFALYIVGFHCTNTLSASEFFVFGRACFIQPEKDLDTNKPPKCDGLEDSRHEPEAAYDRIDFELLGAYDWATIYGSKDFQVFGKDRDRIRAYLILQPFKFYEKTVVKYAAVPTSLAWADYYTPYGYTSSVSVNSQIKPILASEPQREQEPSVLSILEIHCPTKKMRTYDSDSVHVKASAGKQPRELCYEAVWEKPKEEPCWCSKGPLLNSEMLAEHYCRQIRKK